MAQIQCITDQYTCDGAGCPSEFSITRWRRPEDSEQDEDSLTLSELFMYAKKLDWTVDTTQGEEKALCPDCTKKNTPILL